MYALLKNELKATVKSLMIWAMAVGGMGLACILLYKSMETSMADMAESFASMGAFSDAFGMSTLSLATLKGYFATEIGTIHSLGSSMFAASIAAVILSKEEDGHTAEYTFTLPVSREKIVSVKFASVIINLIIFNCICALLYMTGFLCLGETEFVKEFVIFMTLQFMMNIEIAAVCFLISALSKKNRLGVGISVAMLLYAFDLMARVIPDLKDVIFITPFSYANATTIFSNAGVDRTALILGGTIFIVLTLASGIIYSKRDLAS